MLNFAYIQHMAYGILNVNPLKNNKFQVVKNYCSQVVKKITFTSPVVALFWIVSCYFSNQGVLHPLANALNVKDQIGTSSFRNLVQFKFSSFWTMSCLHIEKRKVMFKKLENSQVVPEYSEMVLPPLTFMVDPTMNLMSRPHHECERREHYSPCSESTLELLQKTILGKEKYQ